MDKLSPSTCQIIIQGFLTYSPPSHSNGTLTFTPKANANGTATVTAEVVDNGSGVSPSDNTGSNTFDINITAINDAPVLTTVGGFFSNPSGNNFIARDNFTVINEDNVTSSGNASIHPAQCGSCDGH